MGSIQIGEKLLRSVDFKDFWRQFTKKRLGGLVPIKNMTEKPIIMLPILNLQRDYDRIKKLDYMEKGERLNRYLWEMDIYLNEKCEHNCPYCTEYIKQVHCCTKGNKKIMSNELLSIIANQTKNTALMKINFFGKDIIQNIPKIEHYFKDYKGTINIFRHFKYWKETLFQVKYNDNVIVTFPIEQDIVLEEWKKKEDVSNITFHFIVCSDLELNKTEEIINYLHINQYCIFPFYNKENREFVRRVFAQSKEEILSEKGISFQKIFSRQKMNNNFFGRLTIMPDGSVSTIKGEKRLGNLYKDTLIQIVNRELSENTAWRKIRNQLPCSDCLMQFLCPSPSSYEKAMQINNICLVKQH
jgi:pseudo-rSAM protein